MTQRSIPRIINSSIGFYGTTVALVKPCHKRTENLYILLIFFFSHFN
jgi:hypothetical protein